MIEDNELPAPNYPCFNLMCGYCGKRFLTSWHLSCHQWNCEALNKAIKNKKSARDWLRKKRGLSKI